MAINWETSHDPQNGRLDRSGVKWPIVYQVNDADDEVTATAFITANAPQTFGGAVLDSLDMASREGLRTFKFRAVYSLDRKTAINATSGGGVPAGGTPDAPELEWELSGETVHITEALETVTYSAGFPANTGKLINVTRDEVKGADVEGNVETLNVVAFFPRSALTEELREAWRAARGKVNDADFLGFPEGSLRFTNAAFRIAGADAKPIPVTFRFQQRPNAVDVEVDPDGPFNVPTVPLVEGWQLLEVIYEPWTDPVSKIQTQRAAHAKLHTIIPKADFSTLEIADL